jgi:hypothetical protein
MVIELAVLVHPLFGVVAVQFKEKRQEFLKIHPGD